MNYHWKAYSCHLLVAGHSVSSLNCELQIVLGTWSNYCIFSNLFRTLFTVLEG